MDVRVPASSGAQDGSPPLGRSSARRSRLAGPRIDQGSLFMQTRQLRSAQEHDGAGLPAQSAYAALTWVAVFFALHVYWYAGGSFGRGGPLPDAIPDSVRGWIFEVLVVSAFPIGGGCRVRPRADRSIPEGRLPTWRRRAPWRKRTRSGQHTGPWWTAS